MSGWQNTDDAYYFTAFDTEAFITSAMRDQYGWCIRPVTK